MEKTPGPWSDPDDATTWPNRTSNANSDAWIARHHDAIRIMRPRVLILNFSNEHSAESILGLSRQLMDALKESSRYHSYRDPEAPLFLDYQLFKFVDLRDPGATKGNARRIPVKDPDRKEGFNLKYSAFFDEAFAREYAIPDPNDPDRFLRLDELVDGGYVHELWFFESGSPSEIHSGAFELVEEKPRYDERFRRIGPDAFVQAGNGGDDEQPWTGRSLRIVNINASRGIGCAMENYAHGLEGLSNSGAIPYYTRYFREYAGLDLKERLGLPFDSLYGCAYGEEAIRYPTPDRMVVTHDGREITVENYSAAGGNAHFPPNARRHYDLENRDPVLSTIEDWRIGSGPGGMDRAEPWTIARFARYRDVAPDCMGPWLVYWRQNMPGLDNRSRDDQGRPMKNWWPFLFY